VNFTADTWYCYDCDNFFDQPAEVQHDPSPGGISLPVKYETIHRCPNKSCQSDDIEPMYSCGVKGCDNFTVGYNEPCDECKAKPWM